MKTLSSPVDLIKKSFEIFFRRENFIYFVKICGIYAIFNVLLLLRKPDFDAMFWITILVSLFFSIAEVEAIRRVVGREKLLVKPAFLVGFRKYFKLFLLGILLELIFIPGFLFLIIPGVIFLVWFAFSRFILVEEDIRITQILKKSKKLVDGRFWQVFGRLFVFGIFTGLVTIVTIIIPYRIGSVISVFLSPLLILPSYLLYKELND
ncbi:MAG TPA: hypothetical protein VL401_00580 [Alphaproteobacteria bacterium]|jgi:hypothetical protein|nr:hypothetical protein [Alphaproteobacteria bacterium]